MTKTTLAYYNPNPSKHEDVADCTVRAYCKAFDTTWENALLVSTMSALKNHRVFNDNKAIQEFLESLGCIRHSVKVNKGSKRPTPDSLARSKEFKDSTLVVSVAKHIVTVQNGKVYDTWDSSDKGVYWFYEVPESAKGSFPRMTAPTETSVKVEQPKKAGKPIKSTTNNNYGVYFIKRLPEGSLWGIRNKDKQYSLAGVNCRNKGDAQRITALLNSGKLSEYPTLKELICVAPDTLTLDTWDDLMNGSAHDFDEWYSMVEDKKQDFYDASTLSGELREENPKLWHTITKEIDRYITMLDILETVMVSVNFKEEGK